MARITVKKDVRSKNREFAEQNRQRFHVAGVLVVNILGSPGAGKTSLIEQTVKRLASSTHILVIEGDVETERDANRIRALGVDAIQIQTHGACHLDASMVADQLASLDLAELDMLLIENIGNLICPAGFDLGEDLRVLVASTTEGDEKPIKYPAMYVNADACVINKFDLIPHTNFDVTEFEAGARRTNRKLQIFHTACTTDVGIDQWCHWLRRALETRCAPTNPPS